MFAVACIARLGSAAILAAGLAWPAAAERIVVPPDTADLQGVLDRAADGDVIVLQAGEHHGPAHRGVGHVGRLRDRGDQHAVEGALA